MGSVGLFGGNRVGYRDMLDGNAKESVRIKVSEKPEIIVEGTADKPYYVIKYKEVGKDECTVGYGSYDLRTCFRWRKEEFEIVNTNQNAGSGEYERRNLI